MLRDSPLEKGEKEGLIKLNLPNPLLQEGASQKNDENKLENGKN